MKIPLSWLKEHIETKLNPQEIGAALTSAGLEVESIEPKDLSFKNVRVVKIVEVFPHPKSSKLSLATVTDGKNSYKVVSGAPNCKVGMKTAYAPPGSSLTDKEGKEFVIKKTEIQGVPSEGMLCSEEELQLLERRPDGIMELFEDFSVGEELASYFSDLILEIAITPNLIHVANVRGIARELAAITGEKLLPLKRPTFQEGKEPIDKWISVSVEDPESAPRYGCRVIQNVEVGPSPSWLKDRIEMCGMRSVNNVVDITNMVMLEIGFPLHAFDYDKIAEKKIIVRKAKPNEKIITLDGKEHFPSSETLLICDAKGPIAIAGVMGGIYSEVSEITANVLLEAAYFDPKSIRRTSKRMDIRTEASYRYERGCDPNGVEEALEHATAWISLLTEGITLKGKIDKKAHDFPEKKVSLRVPRVEKILGVSLSLGEIETLLKKLGFRVHSSKGELIQVSSPTYRHDIHEEIDLVEEVARIYGYDNLHKKEKPFFRTGTLPNSPAYLFEKEIRLKLISEGLQELLTCDLISPEEAALVAPDAMPSRSLIKILNPSSHEQSVMRPSLLPGLLKVAKYNADHENSSLAGFEVGRVHFKSKENYLEPTAMAILLMGKFAVPVWNKKGEEVDFFDLKGIVENLFENLKIAPLRFAKSAYKNFHPGRQASIFAGKVELGTFGEVHPETLKKIDLKSKVYYAEFNLEDLKALVKEKIRMKPLAAFPSSSRDWTLTLNSKVPIQKLFDWIEEFKSPLLEFYSLLDVYVSEKLGLGSKNVTLRFIYRDLGKTIAIQDVENEHKRMTEMISEKINKDLS